MHIPVYLGAVCIYVCGGPKLKLMLCSSDIVSVPWGLRARLWWLTISPQDPLVTTSTCALGLQVHRTAAINFMSVLRI